MSNELLEALKDGDENKLKSICRYNSIETIRANILDMLALQRQECAEKAEARVHKDMKFIEIDKQSILNAKLF